jgi:voltage-gated potassium channel Kch
VENAKFTDRIRYKFDGFMSKGTIALIGGLGVLSVLVILAAATVILLIDIRPAGSEERFTFGEALWSALMRTLDAGTMGGDAGWAYRFVMFGVTLGGVFIISTLIGVLTSGIEAKMEDLRKGRSRVIESNHTVVLGWSPQIFTIISELVSANANQKRSCIVIMAEKDMIEMMDEIKSNVGETGRTRIVCRTGSPIDINDIAIVSPGTARSIIILSSNDENPDAGAIKTMMAVINRRESHHKPYHIVTEIRHSHNSEAARLAGKDQVEIVLVGDLISRIIAQTCRQSGLSIVYTELLNFGGDEIYFKSEPDLVGKAFGESLMAYEDSTVIGLQKEAGQIFLNPPMDLPIEAGDRLIAISEDDDTIQLSGKTMPEINTEAIQMRKPAPQIPEKILILGWNGRASAIVRELNHYVGSGSQVWVVADQENAQEQVASCCPDSGNLRVEFIFGDTTNRTILDSLNLETFQNIIVLAYSDVLPEQQADARTLLTLLHLRDIADRGGHSFAIVSEMLDVRNRALAEVTHADDFIVSDQLISLILAQVSENKALNAVFEDIFDPEGSEIYLKPAADYVALDAPVSFYTVVESARRRNQIAIGYHRRVDSTNAAKNYGVVVNPTKSDKVAFTKDDRIILVADE